MGRNKEKNKTDSVFNNMEEPKDLSKVFEEIEEKIEVNTDEEIEEEQVDNNIFEIEIKTETRRVTFYSSDVTFSESDPYTLIVKDAFSKLILSEEINPTDNYVITEECRQNLKDPNFKITLERPVSLKVIQKAEWMDRDMEETQRIFDEKVLLAFRQYKQNLDIIYKQVVQAKPSSIKSNNKWEGINRKEIKGL